MMKNIVLTGDAFSIVQLDQKEVIRRKNLEMSVQIGRVIENPPGPGMQNGSAAVRAVSDSSGETACLGVLVPPWQANDLMDRLNALSLAT